MRRWLVVMSVLLLVSTAFAAQALAASPPTPLKLGILAFRPKPQEILRWQPLATYLEATLAHPVELTLYNFAELHAAASQRQVDVVLTNPGHSILLQQSSGLSAPLATLIVREGP
jgi:ABC-type phosphate/phosphonate transport system substrate-binding protein